LEEQPASTNGLQQLSRDLGPNGRDGRLCASCNQVKSRDLFSKRPKIEEEIGMCNPCVQGRLAAPNATSKGAAGETTEIKGALCCVGCSACKMESFSKAQRKLGASAQCNTCVNKERAEKQKAEKKCCAGCKKSKNPGCFSKAQILLGASAQCIKCVRIVEAAVEEEARRPALELERENARKKYQMEVLKEQKWMEDNGTQIKMSTFEVPGAQTPWDPDDLLGYSPEVTYKGIPTLASLVGSYDLIFYYCAGGEEDENRATKGSLDFTIDATGELHGIVALHNSVKNDVWHHHYDAKITCKQSKWISAFELTNMEELENLCYDNDVEGTIRRVATRQAVRYMPESSDGDDIKDYERDYGKSIQSGNSQEAQLILDKYLQCNAEEPFTWLCNHKNLPVGLSSLIRGFATSKPQPIFFFEEDDLFLTFDWSTCQHEGYKTVLVARRRIQGASSDHLWSSCAESLV
jgi:hypothetical protein